MHVLYHITRHLAIALPFMFTKTFFSEFSDIFVPESMLNIVNDPGQSTRREKNHQLLQARAVVALTFTTIIALAYQLTIDISFHEETVLYCLPREIITFQQAATIEVYYFLASSCFVVFFGNEGFWKLSHANFFVVPPFSYIFVSRKFGKNITMFVSAIYALSFLSSLGGQAPILGPNQGAWVVLDCYVLSFIYWLFAAYEQEREHNEMMLQKSLDEARSAMSAKSMFISNVSHGR
ncbi:hypothetical protein BC936DRAFT_149180 [Jimgerdemannia flammicorona]|uniref:Uncharacterized protein n=1 Tax=Jimgerdemannia flammicorona TaxID=994334 RepID=A0A433D1D6_9FUNG|nr:hypothetical protein BC936DRAFT_149180 [Jimgerdemannia flammicorona]